MLEKIILLLIHNLQACKQWIKQRGQHVKETTLFPNMHISVFTKRPRHQTTNCGTWKYLNHKWKKAAVSLNILYFRVLILSDEEPGRFLICHYFHRQWVISEWSRDDCKSSLCFERVSKQLPFEPLLLSAVAWGQGGQIVHNVFKIAR